MAKSAGSFNLTGCNVEPDSSPEISSEEQGDDQSASNVVSQNQLGEEYYRPAINQDGNYETSNSRGVTLRLNSGLNIGLFEKDFNAEPVKTTSAKSSTCDYCDYRAICGRETDEPLKEIKTLKNTETLENLRKENKK